MPKKPLSERNIKVIIPAKTPEETRQEKRKIRVAAYCRVSTDSKEQETSFDSQVTYYTELINKNPDWELVDIYADPAISGTSRKNRKRFNEMLYHCLKGEIDMVITKSMSRFARNQLDSLAVIRMLNGLYPPVRVLFEDDHINSDDLSSEIIIIITSMLAEQESVKKSTSVKWGFERRKEQGHYLVPTQNLLGLDNTEAINKDDREIFIVEDEADTVRVIFGMLLIGYTISEIAYTLTLAGAKTGKGNTFWNTGSVLGILKNERYAGDVRTNKTYRENVFHKQVLKNDGKKPYIYETDHHPAIVSHEVFEMAQKLIASHRYGYDAFVNCTYSLTVIDEGLLKGFIPINIHWAGSGLNEYLALASTVEQTKDLLKQSHRILYFPGCEVLRRQDIGHARSMAMKITPSSIGINNACGEIIASDYIEILFNPVEKLIAIRPSKKELPGALRWKKEKDGKEVTVSIGCTAFMTIVYQLMKWPKLWNTSILAVPYQRDGEGILIFDLTQPEINALPYEKPKPKKKSESTDVFYSIEAMIAQQLELLHNRQDGEVVLEEEEESEEMPSPKREKIYPSEWADSFGPDSIIAAVSNRRLQFETLKEWNVMAEGVRVAEFDHAVKISGEDIEARIAKIRQNHEQDEVKD